MPRVRNIKLTHKVMYEEFAEAVRELIRKEKLWGRYLASESALGKLFGVSRETVRRGMRLLENQGLISRQQGRGTFVLPKSRSSSASSHGQTRVVVGAYGSGFKDGYAAGIIAGLGTASAHTGTALSFVNLMLPEARRHLPLDLRAGKFDGVALMSFTDRSYVEDLLRIWSGPMVLMDHYYPDLPVAGVMDDGEGGARQAMAHLLSLGHRRIGFIDIGIREHNTWRHAGYLGALKEAGIEPDESLIVPSFSSFQSGRAATDQLLALPEPPTAILAFDDLRAWGALRAMEVRGLSAGRDLALVGFGDRAAQFGFRDILTTVRFDSREIGRLALDHLKRQIQGRAKPDRLTLVPTELIVRESSGENMAPGENSARNPASAEEN